MSKATKTKPELVLTDEGAKLTIGPYQFNVSKDDVGLLYLSLKNPGAVCRVVFNGIEGGLYITQIGYVDAGSNLADMDSWNRFGYIPAGIRNSFRVRLESYLNNGALLNTNQEAKAELSTYEIRAITCAVRDGTDGPSRTIAAVSKAFDLIEDAAQREVLLRALMEMFRYGRVSLMHVIHNRREQAFHQRRRAVSEKRRADLAREGLQDGN